jgi:hypothetical protein
MGTDQLNDTADHLCWLYFGKKSRSNSELGFNPSMASISSNPRTDAAPTRTWWSPSSPSTPDNELENATLWRWNRIAAAETSISGHVPTFESPVPVFDSILFAWRSWASISRDSNSRASNTEYEGRGAGKRGARVPLVVEPLEALWKSSRRVKLKNRSRRRRSMTHLMSREGVRGEVKWKNGGGKNTDVD